MTTNISKKTESEDDAGVAQHQAKVAGFPEQHLVPVLQEKCELKDLRDKLS